MTMMMMMMMMMIRMLMLMLTRVLLLLLLLLRARPESAKRDKSNGGRVSKQTCNHSSIPSITQYSHKPVHLSVRPSIQPSTHPHMHTNKHSSTGLHIYMVGPWMLSSQNGLDHGRRRGWAMDARPSERIRPFIMVLPWTPSSQNGLDHRCHHGWAMDALFSERIKPWTSSCLGGLSTGKPANVDGFSYCRQRKHRKYRGLRQARKREFGGARNTDGSDVFGT